MSRQQRIENNDEDEKLQIGQKTSTHRQSYTELHVDEAPKPGMSYLNEKENRCTMPSHRKIDVDFAIESYIFYDFDQEIRFEGILSVKHERNFVKSILKCVVFSSEI